MVKKDEIIELLNLKASGNKGWYIGNCPICGTEDKFGVVFSENSASFNCFAGKCQEKGHIFRILKLLDRTDLISFQYNPIVQLKNTITKEEIGIDLSEPPVKELPRLFKRIYYDEYLESRNFTKEHFEKYIIGESEDITLRNYLIFGIIENGEWKGYVARSRKSKEWIDKYNIEAKVSGNPKCLRWKNSVNTDFDKLFFGIDEVTNKTKTIILVEGITSKANIDYLLKLFSVDDIKCLATFGKVISKYKINKLKELGIENIILLYDPDAISNSKKYSIQLAHNFNTQVGYLKNGDPGDLTYSELCDILDNLQSPLNFNINIIDKKTLLV